MMKRTILFGGFLAWMIGCASLRLKPADYPVHVYEQPFDLVYLKTYEALSKDRNWVPYRTDKSSGIIEVRNITYGTWDDMDKQFVRFLVKTVSRTETSVELDAEVSRCKGQNCLNLLNTIHNDLSQLPIRSKPEEPPHNP